MKILRHSLLYFLIFHSTISLSQKLKIFHIDVDQGDATLFISPNGSTMLVDAGRNNHGARIKKILDLEGKTKIDHYVTTHYHDDHYGGIDELFNDPEISIMNSYDRGDKEYLPASKLRQSNYKNYINTVGEKAIVLYRGDKINLDPAMTITCLSKGGIVLGEPYSDYAGNENDMSVSFLIEFGDFRYFIGGDMHAYIERKIAERDLAMDVDVYQANHHGSQSSSSIPFITDLSPTVVVISSGNAKRYAHPRKSTLNNLSNLNLQPVIFQTNKYLADNDKASNVPDEFIGDLTSVGEGGTILVEVNQKTYTITNRDQLREFDIKSRVISDKLLVIKSLVPNPVGSDYQNETVTLQNKTNTTIDLDKWFLSDASAKRWYLRTIGEMAPNAEITIVRKGQAMSLNNKGDFIMLFNDDQVVDKFQYDSSKEGVAIQTGH